METCKDFQETLPTSTPLPQLQKNLRCDICFTRFRNESGFKQHIEKCNSTVDNKTENVQTLKHQKSEKEILRCPKCDFQCVWFYTYKKHIKTNHTDEYEKLLPTLRIPKLDKKCPLCSFSHTIKSDILNHFTDHHNIKLQTKYYVFSNMSQFYEWKNKMEKDTTCRYVQNSKSITEKGKRITFRYICHRSGYYRCQNKKIIKKKKSKGSNKINGFCPSELTVTSEKGSCEVHYIKTHIGHSNEIHRITLTVEERDYIASKIANKISFEKILEEVRSHRDPPLDRLQLLNRKDLYNIAKRYSLIKSAIFWEDKDINTWVEETAGVLFYKAAKTRCDQYPFLVQDDFMLVVMNENQKEIFIEFSKDMVCIDALIGNNSQFDLVTLMVRDNARAGFPCSFLFSNRSDEKILELYFTLIRDNIGSNRAEVKALMTDENNVYVNAWSNVMGKPNRRLLCSWSVDKIWRTKLSKIKSLEERKACYTALKNLQTESIEHKFRDMVDEFLTNKDMDAEFVEFFTNNFIPYVRMWACCYRIDDGMNEDCQLLQLREHLKYICTYGKKQRSLCQILFNITRLVSDCLLNRRLILNSNDTVYHLNLIQKRHRDSYLGNFDSIITVEEGWHVPSFAELNEPYELYFVQEVLTKCGCNYVCTECHACIHQYACTCDDSSFGNNMCKHIHMAIRFKEGKKHFILDEGNGTFKDIEPTNSDSSNEYFSETDNDITIENQEEQNSSQISQIENNSQKSPDIVRKVINIDTGKPINTSTTVSNSIVVTKTNISCEVSTDFETRKNDFLSRIVNRVKSIKSHQELESLEKIISALDDTSD